MKHEIAFLNSESYLFFLLFISSKKLPQSSQLPSIILNYFPYYIYRQMCVCVRVGLCVCDVCLHLCRCMGLSTILN